jgi:uncharacterized protein YigE (DUF2233 family)
MHLIRGASIRRRGHDLRLQKIIFTTSDDGKRKTFPECAGNLSRSGMKSLLVTNAGIYGTDNRPLGLLISPKGKLHDADPRTDTGPAHGNFSWDSAVFQISDDDTASIVPVGNWQDSRHIVAGTQSGPQLASAARSTKVFKLSPSGPIVAPPSESINRIEGLSI